MADLKKKVEYALSETRTLVLGTQILFGFQFHAVFQPGFERLSAPARWSNLAALALMTVGLAVLIAPAAFHRLAESGDATGRTHSLTTAMATTALFPMGLGLGIDVFIVTERLFGWPVDLIIGLAVSLTAALFWYGIEAFWRADREGGRVQQEQDHDKGSTSLDEKIKTLQTEIRVILPGVQALLGFQFIAFLTDAFERLAPAVKLLHLGSLLLVALSTILLMAPAAYHRLVAGGEARADVDRFGSNAMLASLVPLALGVSGEIAVAMMIVAKSPGAALAGGAVALSLFIGLWLAYPLLARATRS